MEHIPTKQLLELDEELRTYMPAVDAETDAELERQLLETKGPVDELTVWKERNIILDGYRRYKICQKHNLPFKLRYVSCVDLDAAKEWMTLWAIARRNVTKNQRAALLHDLVAIRMRRGVCRSKAEQEVGSIAGVSREGVRNDYKFAEQLEKLDKPVRKKIINSKVKTPAKTIHRLAALPPEKQAEIVESVDLNGRGALTVAVAKAREDWTEVDATAPGSGIRSAKNRMMERTRQTFGVFLKHLNNLNRENPNPTAMARAKLACDQISNILDAWSAE